MVDGRVPILLLGLAASVLPGAAGPGVAVDDRLRVTLAGSVHPRLAGLRPAGAAAPDLPMARMLLVLRMPAGARARLEQLLRDQQDPASPDFHRWLTADGFGARFGLSPAQLDAAAGWLRQQGFTVHGTARSGLAITFSGTAAQVGKAFRTAILEYDLDGVRHHGNGSAISIPQGLAGFVDGVVSLNDLGRASQPRKRAARVQAGAPGPQVTAGSGGNVIGAGDFAAIYDLAPLFLAGTTGRGVTLAVVGRTDLDTNDPQRFVTDFNLAQYGGTLQVVHNGADPGIVSADEEFEADADTQWACAAAPGATVKLVVSGSTFTTDGVDLSAQYIVDNDLAPVLTCSFAASEAELGGSGNLFYSQLWAQAASEGISVFVASGDSGAAGGANPNDASADAAEAGVSGMASTPYGIGVGGTEFDETANPGVQYWKPAGTVGSFQATALGYIPEAGWNESGAVAGGSGLWASGGGFSTVYPRPSWQVAPGAATATGGFREVPDVAFSASAGHDPYVVFQGGQAFLGGGTSLAAPAMAGIMALVVQAHGRQGNPGPMLYRLGNAQYLGTGPVVFHDVTTGNDQVPGLPLSFSAGPGYDPVTGLGSLDAAALVSNWAGGNPITVTLASPAGPETVPSGTQVSFSGSAVDTGGGTLSYQWSFGDGSVVVPTATATHQYLDAGTTAKTYLATFTASDGVNSQSGTLAITVTPTVNLAITLPVANVGVLPGVPVVFNGTGTTLNSGSPLVYSWSFGDGSPAATGANVTHTFPENAAAPFAVTLTAADATGAVGTAAISVISDTATVMDVNRDGAADVRDLLVLAGAWNPSLQATPTAFGGLDFAADLNGDGRVDDTDLDLWISHFVPGAP